MVGKSLQRLCLDTEAWINMTLASVGGTGRGH
jgi:hypothetical protein